MYFKTSCIFLMWSFGKKVFSIFRVRTKSYEYICMGSTAEMVENQHSHTVIKSITELSVV